jgi:hypothetical protein
MRFVEMKALFCDFLMPPFEGMSQGFEVAYLFRPLRLDLGSTLHTSLTSHTVRQESIKMFIFSSLMEYCVIYRQLSIYLVSSSLSVVRVFRNAEVFS